MLSVCSGGNVTGIYEVSGTLEPAGRGLILEPIPDSWKAQPKNFVMATWLLMTPRRAPERVLEEHVKLRWYETCDSCQENKGELY